MDELRALCRWSDINTVWDILEVCAYAVMGPETSMGLNIAAIRRRFERWCYVCKYIQNPDGDVDEPALIAPAAPVVAAPVAPAKKKRSMGSAAVLQALAPKHDASGGAEGGQGGDESLRNPRQRFAFHARAWATRADRPGAMNGADVLRWWRDEGAKSLPDLLTGVRVLLSLPAHNCGLEWIFRQCKFLLRDHRKRDRMRSLVLRHNAKEVRLPGYVWDSDDSESEVE